MKYVLHIILILLIALTSIALWLVSIYVCCLKPCPMQPHEMKAFRQPIDVVYTWVDGHDDTWRRAQDAWRLKAGLKPIDPERNPTPNLLKDELYFSIRAVRHYMPWHRRIYILTQTPQRPQWLTDKDLLSDTIHVVHHKDIFGEHAALPSFNGILNTSQVHRIPGLAEHFIYFDDDHFVGQHLQPGHFFDGNGNPVYKFNMELAAWFETSPYAAILRKTAALIKRVTRSPWLFRVHHLPIPVTKTACYHIEKAIGPEPLEAMQRFRTPQSYEFPLIVANYFLGEGTSRRPPNGLKTKWCRRADKKILDQLANPNTRPHMYCINAGFDNNVSKKFEETIYKNLS